MERDVILFSTDPTFLERRGHVLDRRSTTVQLVPQPANLARLLESETPQLVVVNGTASPELLWEVLDILKDATSDQQTAVMVVALPEDARQLPRWLGERERVRVMPAPVEDGELLSASAKLAGWPVRRHIRVLVHVRVQVRGTIKTLFGFTQDLSAGGMGLILEDNELHVGDEASVRFWLPQGKDEIIVNATVLHQQSSSDGIRYGLHFTAVQPYIRSQIDAFVDAEH